VREEGKTALSLSAVTTDFGGSVDKRTYASINCEWRCCGRCKVVIFTTYLANKTDYAGELDYMERFVFFPFLKKGNQPKKQSKATNEQNEREKRPKV